MQSDGHQQIKTKHFVLAIGSAGQNPVMPELNNRVGTCVRVNRLDVWLIWQR